MMNESVALARYEGLGSVTRCAHGCIHVQLGFTTMTLTEEQYVRLVAMLNDSAAHFANFEFLRRALEESTSDEDEPLEGC